MQHSYLEALLWKNMYHFLERCRNCNNVWFRALMQSDFLYSSLLFEHCNRILLCDWVLGRCSIFFLRVCACHNTSVLYLALTKVGLSVLLWMQCCTKCYGLVNNSVRKVFVTLLFYLQSRYELFCCVCFYQSVLCRLCVFVFYALSRYFSKRNVKWPVWTCRVPISLIIETGFSMIPGTRFSILRTQIGSLKRLNKTLDLVFVTKL